MNKKRVIWLVPVLVMAFAMSACNSNEDEGGKGDNLSFVDKEVFNKDGSSYTGDKLLTVAGGSGQIRGGKMTFNIGVPNGLKSMTPLLSEMDTRYGHNVFSYAGYDPADTQAYELVLSNLTKKTLEPAASIPREEIKYIYVDRDCTVTGRNIPSFTIDGGISVKVSDYTWKLKKGWNPVGMVLMATTTDNTLVIGPGDSDSCKWVYE